MTQQELADEVGMSRGQVSRLENGWNAPASGTADLLAERFRDPVEYYELEELFPVDTENFEAKLASVQARLAQVEADLSRLRGGPTQAPPVSDDGLTEASAKC
jgi:transcriptional regulator with XRE-family HTH domain